MTMNGVRTTAPISTAKMLTAATRPRTRLWISDPMPWLRKPWIDTSDVTLLKSDIDRMNSTRPDDDDGDRLPNTAS